MQDVVICEGLERMDMDAVNALLAQTTWSAGISRAEVEKGARNSTLVVGAFDAQGRQVGYARVVSDKTRFAYLMDVIVHPDLRDRGVGRQLVEHILRHPDLQDVYQWMLLTTRAHDFYRSLGFVPTRRADNLMEICFERPRR